MSPPAAAARAPGIPAAELRRHLRKAEAALASWRAGDLAIDRASWIAFAALAPVIHDLCDNGWPPA